MIALARGVEAEWAITDNAHARRAARSLGIRPRGTIGVLLVEEIRVRPGFWISEQLCDAALETVRKSI